MEVFESNSSHWPGQILFDPLFRHMIFTKPQQRCNIDSVACIRGHQAWGVGLSPSGTCLGRERGLSSLPAIVIGVCALMGDMAVRGLYWKREKMSLSYPNGRLQYNHGLAQEFLQGLYR